MIQIVLESRFWLKQPHANIEPFYGLDLIFFGVKTEKKYQSENLFSDWSKYQQE